MCFNQQTVFAFDKKEVYTQRQKSLAFYQGRIDKQVYKEKIKHLLF